MDQELLTRIIGTVIRNGVAPVTAYLVAKGWLVEGDAAQIITVAITALSALIWGIWAKYRDVAKQKLALAMPAGSTVAQLKEVAKSQNV